MENTGPRFPALIGPAVAALLLLTLLTGNLRFFFSTSYVSWQYSRMNSPPALGSGPNGESRVNIILEYINSPSERPPGMTRREADHLADVANLVTAARRLSLVTMLILAALLFGLNRSNPGRSFWRRVSRSALSAAVLLTLFMAALWVNFNWIFTGFHRLFFSGDSWLFPADSLLIQAFPAEFWLRSASDWVLLTLTELAVISTAAALLGRTLKSQIPN